VDPYGDQLFFANGAYRLNAGQNRVDYLQSVEIDWMF
jgi:hypothetical protein